jgi:asparagine synthase (glutamine-hydrolysing)
VIGSTTEIEKLLLPDASSADLSRLLVDLNEVAADSVRTVLRDCKDNNFAVSFSGGIDSCVLAFIARSVLNQQVPLLSVGSTGSHDIRFLSDRTFEEEKRTFDFAINEVGKDEIKEAARKTRNLVNSSSLPHLEDCIAFYLIGERLRARSTNAKYIITANGPDELFCGYDRFRRLVDSEGYRALPPEIERSIAVARSLKSQIKVVLDEFDLVSLDPFLSDHFVEYCAKSLPVEYKILQGNDRIRKRIWRIYGTTLGIPDSIVLKPKRAMQYSMGIHSVVSRMVKRGELTTSFGLLNVI